MILKSYDDLASTIREAMPQIVFIDIDKGQLENPEAFESILTPGLLIEFSKIKWETFGQGTQKGYGTVTLKLVVLLPAQTNISDPLFASNLDPFALATALNQAIKPVGFMRPRIGSHDYPVRTWHVIEQTYDVCLEADPPNYKRITVPVNIIPQLTKPTVTQ